MLPLLKQCYESALSARSLANAIKKGEVGSFRLALSQSIDQSVVMPHVIELGKLFHDRELKLLRGNAFAVIDFLKRGNAELGLGATIGCETTPQLLEVLRGRGFDVDRAMRQARSPS
jgi:hypothetical protein